MPSTYTHSLSVIAYGCRYRAPIKLSLSYFTPRHLHSHRRLPISQSPLVSALSATAFFLRSSLPNTHIFTGNSLFSRMEVTLPILHTTNSFVYLTLLYPILRMHAVYCSFSCFRSEIRDRRCIYENFEI